MQWGDSLLKIAVMFVLGVTFTGEKRKRPVSSVISFRVRTRARVNELSRLFLGPNPMPKRNVAAIPYRETLKSVCGVVRSWLTTATV